MTDITVGYHDDRLVAVKETDDPGRSARLGRKADPLSRLDHPGNVRLVDLTEGPPAILRTVFVGPDTWQRRAPVDEFRAPALAALIAAVADESRIVVTDIGSASPSVTEIVLHELGPVTVPPTTAPFESPATNPATPPPRSSHCAVDHRHQVGRARRQPLGDRRNRHQRTQRDDNLRLDFHLLRRVLEANADHLVDPDLIMPGQMLTRPPLTAGS
jgi:hypothetical protein